MSIEKIAGINEYDLILGEDGHPEDQDNDDLDEELDALGNDDVIEDDDDGLPAKFKGKSPTEIAKAYAELEKEKGRIANEVGELRKLTKEFLEHQVSTQKTPADEIEDEFDFDNPQDTQTAIRKEVERQTKEVKEQVKQAEFQTRFEKFAGKHPDYYEVGDSDGFAKFVGESAYRQKMLAQAREGDLDAADELLSTYKQMNNIEAKQAEDAAAENRQNRRARVKKDAPVTGSVGTKARGKIWTSAEIIRMKMYDPDQYHDRQDEIMQAYNEGRVK